MIESVIATWHDFLHTREPEQLERLLADDVVFHSPIVYTPQRGRDITSAYLQAAARVLLAGTGEHAFRYTRQVLAGDTAVLEFETSVGSTWVNGVDIIRCDEQERIVEFRVMLRPLRAVNAVHEKMAELLRTGPR